MNIVVSFMGSRESGAQKHKDHAQDCGTLIAIRDSASGDPAMVFIFRMASISRQSRAPCPVQRRIAADVVEHDPYRMMLLRMIVSEKFGVRLFGRSCENARIQRAYSLKSTTNVMLFKQRLVTRLVLPLDVIEQRTACCDHFKRPGANDCPSRGFEVPVRLLMRSDRIAT